MSGEVESGADPFYQNGELSTVEAEVKPVAFLHSRSQSVTDCLVMHPKELAKLHCVANSNPPPGGGYSL